MTLAELITDLKAAGANENTMQLAMNCYELGLANAQRKPLTDEMVVAAARVLNERQADACGVDRDDQWAIYSDDFKADALAMLKAAHGIKGAS